jgi:O-antigen ligase
MSRETKQITTNQQTQLAPTSHTKVFIALLITVFIMPWPHGGEIVWQYLLFCISIFSLGAIYFFTSNTNNAQNTSHTKSQHQTLTSLKAPLFLLGAWLLFQIIQIIPLPTSITGQSTNASNHWQTISIAPNVTLVELIKHTSYITVFILTLCLLTTKKRILALANTLFFVSAIIALYSLINHYTNGGFDLISSIPPWTASWQKAAHGTFSYQNHYASFLTLTIPLGYGLLYANIKQNRTKIGKGKRAKIVDLLMSANGIYLLNLLIMITALFKTASRGGNSIFIISIAITFLCVQLQQNKSTKQKIKKVGALAVSMLAVGIMVLATGVTDTLTKRLDSQGYTPNGRDLMHQTAFAIIKESPIVGMGAGTYPILQHKYKSATLGYSAMSKRAHNEYLELLTNQGIIGFSLLAIATILLLTKLVTGLKKNKKGKTTSLHGLQIASFCAVTAILLHSLADFNFHLPTNAVYFYLILAIGIKIPLLKKQSY